MSFINRKGSTGGGGGGGYAAGQIIWIQANMTGAEGPGAVVYFRDPISGNQFNGTNNIGIIDLLDFKFFDVGGPTSPSLNVNIRVNTIILWTFTADFAQRNGTPVVGPIYDMIHQDYVPGGPYIDESDVLRIPTNSSLNLYNVSTPSYKWFVLAQVKLVSLV